MDKISFAQSAGDLGDQLRGGMVSEFQNVNTGGHSGGTITSTGGGGTITGPVSTSSSGGFIGGNPGLAVADASGGNHNLSFVS